MAGRHLDVLGPAAELLLRPFVRPPPKTAIARTRDSSPSSASVDVSKPTRASPRPRFRQRDAAARRRLRAAVDRHERRDVPPESRI